MGKEKASDVFQPGFPSAEFCYLLDRLMEADHNMKEYRAMWREAKKEADGLGEELAMLRAEYEKQLQRCNEIAERDGAEWLEVNRKLEKAIEENVILAKDLKAATEEIERVQAIAAYRRDEIIRLKLTYSARNTGKKGLGIYEGPRLNSTASSPDVCPLSGGDHVFIEGKRFELKELDDDD